MVWRRLKEAGASGTALWQSLGRITGLPKSRNLTLGVALDDTRLTPVFGDFGRNQGKFVLKEREVNQFYRAIAALREVTRGKPLETMGIKILVPKKGLPTALHLIFPMFMAKLSLYACLPLELENPFRPFSTL